MKDSIKNKIERAINEEPVYKSPLMFLPSFPSFKSYEEMKSLGFEPKYRKIDEWKPEEIAKLKESIHQIQSNELVPGVNIL